MDDSLRDACAHVFQYPTARPTRHQPRGYADYQSYKPWLRDEFTFRCVYCLVRERWEADGHHGFGVEHLRAQLDMDGNRLWERKFPKMTTLAEFGEGASPALQDNVLIIPWDEERQSFVAGIDTTTGNELWRTQRETDSAWTTPLIVNDGEKFVAIVVGSTHTRAYDVRSGKEVWNCGGMSMNPTASPVADGDVVIVGNNYKGKVVQAIRFAGATGDITQKANLLWTYGKSASYVPTPIVIDGKLYFLKGTLGILVSLDAKTGDVIFAGKRIGLKNVHASPIVADNRIYISSRDGDTAVIEPGDDCKILAKNHLDDVFDASPVAIGSRLILRGRKNLYCIE